MIRALSAVKPLRGKPEVDDTKHGVFCHPLDALRCLLINLGGQLHVHMKMAGDRSLSQSCCASTLRSVTATRQLSIVWRLATRRIATTNGESSVCVSTES